MVKIEQVIRSFLAVGGLLPIASAEKNGLMSSSLFIENMVVKLSQSNGGNTSLYKVAYRNAFILSDVFVLTDVGSYVSYRIVYSGNLSFPPSVERMGHKGSTGISNLRFYKDSGNNVYMLVTTGSYGLLIFNTNCVSSSNSKPILEKQPSTDVSNFTEIAV